MRCPKCGAFMEEGKDVCLMCGVNVKTYVPETNMNNSFGNGDSAFGSGNDFRNPNIGGFNRNNVNNNDYKNASYAPLKNEDKDIFDFAEDVEYGLRELMEIKNNKGDR